jgi:type I restriction enzyme M protein
MRVELTAPKPNNLHCDSTCGTAGFRVGAAEYLREKYPYMPFNEA